MFLGVHWRFIGKMPHFGPGLQFWVVRVHVHWTQNRLLLLQFLCPLQVFAYYYEVLYLASDLDMPRSGFLKGQVTDFTRSVVYGQL